MTNLALSQTPDETPESLGLLPSRVDWSAIVGRMDATGDETLTDSFIMCQDDGFLGEITPLDELDDLSSEYAFAKAEMGSGFDTAIDCPGGVCPLSDDDFSLLDGLEIDLDV